MHSMGMSMVRERSVKSFLGRIQTRKLSDTQFSDTKTTPIPRLSTTTTSAVPATTTGSGSGSGSVLLTQQCLSYPNISDPTGSGSVFLTPPKSAVGWLELRKVCDGVSVCPCNGCLFAYLFVCLPAS